MEIKWNEGRPPALADGTWIVAEQPAFISKMPFYSCFRMQEKWRATEKGAMDKEIERVTRWATLPLPAKEKNNGRV